MTDQQIVDGVWAVVTVLIMVMVFVVADATLKAMDPKFRWFSWLPKRADGKRRKVTSK